jgi:hypothetical protein
VRHRPWSWIPGVTVTLVVVLLVSACGSEEPSEVVVSGRALRNSQWAIPLHHIGLFLGDTRVASGLVREDGSFVIRVTRTDDMEQAQSKDGFVVFRLRGSSFRDEEAAHCEGQRDLRMRFENGHWVAPDTRRPAVIVFKGTNTCPYPGTSGVPFTPFGED